MTGYTLFNSPRTLNKSRGGGVVLYVDNNFDSTLISKFTVENGYFECIGILIKSANNRVTNNVSLSRPPDTSIDDFTASIEDLLKNKNQQTYNVGTLTYIQSNINNMSRQIYLSIKCFR